MPGLGFAEHKEDFSVRIGMLYQMSVPKSRTADSESNRFWEMVEKVLARKEALGA